MWVAFCVFIVDRTEIQQVWTNLSYMTNSNNNTVDFTSLTSLKRSISIVNYSEFLKVFLVLISLLCTLLLYFYIFFSFTLRNISIIVTNV